MNGVLLLLALCCACATPGPDPALWELPSRPEQGMLDRDLWDTSPARTLRHQVRLRIPGKGLDLTFGGMMRLEPRDRSVRLVALGGFGLKLFDLTVTPNALHTHFLHPGLKRVPNMAERIAFCVRRIWLGYQPDAQDALLRTANATILYGRHQGVRLEHGFHDRERTFTQAHGPDEHWRITFTRQSGSHGEPETIVFTDTAPRYELQVRLVTKEP